MQYNIFDYDSYLNISDYPEYYKEALGGYYCCFARGGLNNNLRFYNNAMILEHRRKMLFKKLIDFYISGKIIDIFLEKEFMICYSKFAARNSATVPSYSASHM